MKQIMFDEVVSLLKNNVQHDGVLCEIVNPTIYMPPKVLVLYDAGRLMVDLEKGKYTSALLQLCPARAIAAAKSARSNNLLHVDAPEKYTWHTLNLEHTHGVDWIYFPLGGW